MEFIDIKETKIDAEGKIVFYTVQDFYDNIVIGDDCFICGAKKGSKIFNDEHILPDWLLRKYSLHDKDITLANSARFKYGRYKVPCCSDCNTLLGRTIEEPISKLLVLTYSEICKRLSEDQSNLHLLFKWLLLIFFKTHLKDTEFSWHLDRRKGDERISDTYEWIDMHHIHCMIRKDFTGARVSTHTIGTFYILQAIQHSTFEPFDFSDNKNGFTIMLRMDEFSIVCALNDAGGVGSLFSSEIKRITGPLTPTQLREVFVHMTYINTHLKERPRFYSIFSPEGEYFIDVIVPETAEIVSESEQSISLGELLHHACEGFIGNVDNRESVLAELKAGHRRYLFNQKGEFIDYRKELTE